MLEKNDWLGVGYIPRDMGTSDGLANAMSSANMRDLLTRNTFRIADEEKIRKLGKKKGRPHLNAI